MPLVRLPLSPAIGAGSKHKQRRPRIRCHPVPTGLASRSGRWVQGPHVFTMSFVSAAARAPPTLQAPRRCKCTGSRAVINAVPIIQATTKICA